MKSEEPETKKGPLNVKLDRTLIEDVRKNLKKTTPFVGSRYDGNHKGNRIVADALNKYLKMSAAVEARKNKEVNKLEEVLSEFEAAKTNWQKTDQDLLDLKTMMEAIMKRTEEK